MLDDLNSPPLAGNPVRPLSPYPDPDTWVLADFVQDIYFTGHQFMGFYDMVAGDRHMVAYAHEFGEVRGYWDQSYNADGGAMELVLFDAATGSFGRLEVSHFGYEHTAQGRAGAGWELVGTADLNLDADNDLIFLREDAGGLSRLGQMQTGPDASLTWRGIASFGQDWAFADTGDFNGDGIDDFLMQHTGTGVLGQYRMAENGSTSWAKIAKMGAGFDVAGSGDFNGDGVDDILVFHETGRRLGYFDMDGGDADWINLGQYGANWGIVGTKDFDLNGRDDILFRNDADNKLGWFDMDASGRSWELIGHINQGIDLFI